jgi:putative polyhydroxyalkanoate system protein
MPDLTIHRDHDLGLAQARKVAFKWAEDAEKRLDMTCTYEEGKTSDTVYFKRSGVDGTLVVTATRFDMHAKLGFLIGAFKGKIEAEIQRNLDELLSQSKKPAAKAATKSAGKAKK